MTLTITKEVDRFSKKQIHLRVWRLHCQRWTVHVLSPFLPCLWMSDYLQDSFSQLEHTMLGIFVKRPFCFFSLQLLAFVKVLYGVLRFNATICNYLNWFFCGCNGGNVWQGFHWLDKQFCMYDVIWRKIFFAYRSPSPYDDRRAREYSAEPPRQYNTEGDHHKDTRYDQQVMRSKREQMYSTSRHPDSYNDQRERAHGRERSPLDRLIFPLSCIVFILALFLSIFVSSCFHVFCFVLAVCLFFQVPVIAT